MWQLVINGPGYFDTGYELPEGLTTIGRADENDIVLSGDLVSRRHARLHLQGDELQLEDLGSRNGSKLNDKPFTGKVTVRAGDVLAIGENTLVIRQPQSSERAATDLLQLSQQGVRRLGSDPQLGSAVVVAKNVRDSVVLRALDNVGRWDNAMVPFATEPAERKVGYEALLLLYRVSERLGASQTLASFLEETVDRLLAQTQATYGVVLLRQPSGVMAPKVVRHRSEESTGEVPVSEGIVFAALEKGEALVVADVLDEDRLPDPPSLVGTTQVVCVPLGQTAPFAGLLYLNLLRPPADAEALLDLVTAVAHLIAAGLEKFELRERGVGDSRLREALARFHARDIVERRVAELSKTGGALTQMENVTGTVLVADIAGFSALVEKIPPERVVELLNEFYRRMTEVIFSFQGTVDKFLGDSVMALFGAPYQKSDDALRAVRTAMALQSEWQRAMAKRPARERSPLKIGLHTGPMLAGTVGWQARLDFTAVGSTVNVAHWLSASARPGQVLITGKTLGAIGARFDVVPLGERSLLEGRAKTAVFEVVEEDLGQGTNPGKT